MFVTLVSNQRVEKTFCGTLSSSWSSSATGARTRTSNIMVSTCSRTCFSVMTCPLSALFSSSSRKGSLFFSPTSSSRSSVRPRVWSKYVPVRASFSAERASSLGECCWSWKDGRLFSRRSSCFFRKTWDTRKGEGQLVVARNSNKWNIP